MACWRTAIYTIKCTWKCIYMHNTCAAYKIVTCKVLVSGSHRVREYDSIGSERLRISFSLELNSPASQKNQLLDTNSSLCRLIDCWSIKLQCWNSTRYHIWQMLRRVQVYWGRPPLISAHSTKSWPTISLSVWRKINTLHTAHPIEVFRVHIQKYLSSAGNIPCQGRGHKFKGFFFTACLGCISLSSTWIVVACIWSLLVDARTGVQITDASTGWVCLLVVCVPGCL